MGLTSVLWNWDSSDYKLALDINKIPQGKIESSALEMAKGSDGVISLEHDFFKNAAERAVYIGDAVLGSGKMIVSMDECVGVSTRFGTNSGLYAQSSGDSYWGWKYALVQSLIMLLI
jgi:hypothetical protein